MKPIYSVNLIPEVSVNSVFEFALISLKCLRFPTGLNFGEIWAHSRTKNVANLIPEHFFMPQSKFRGTYEAHLKEHEEGITHCIQCGLDLTSVFSVKQGQTLKTALKCKFQISPGKKQSKVRKLWYLFLNQI